MNIRALLCLVLAVVASLAHTPVYAGKTLDAIRQRGHLQCGVSTGVVGFSAPDNKGRWSGFDVDLCRAVAVAVLGDADKVVFVPLNAQQRFVALQSGQIDLLSRNTSWTLTRDASLGLSFTAITYLDGQGFLVPKKFKVSSASQLKGAQICLQAGTTNEKNLADYAKARHLAVKPVVFDTYQAAVKALISGRCQAFSADVSALASIRQKETPRPDDYLILPDVISKEPLGPLVRRGDDDWFTIVRWTVFAMQEAEELGISQRNVDGLRTSVDPAIQRFIGGGEDMGKLLGLDKQWAYRIVRSVGNYGDVYERNIGAQSPLKLPRGLNKPWNQGGLIYAPPIR